MPSRQARAHVLSSLAAENPTVFAQASSPSEGLAAPGARGAGLLARQHIAHSAAVLSVLESPSLATLAASLLGCGQCVTTGYKWLRCVTPGEFTGVHADCVFLGRGAAQQLTIWLPLGDTPVELGGLLVCRASHRLAEYAGLHAAYTACSDVGGDGRRHGGGLAPQRRRRRRLALRGLRCGRRRRPADGDAALHR